MRFDEHGRLHLAALPAEAEPPSLENLRVLTNRMLPRVDLPEISVTIAATLGTREPLRGQLRIALNNGVTPEEIVEAFIHIEAYAGAARAFDSYQIVQQVFQEVPRAK